jgi:bifunctional ADP-heptose synthase (sugar kinase/adenylyltransferase)
MNLLSVHRAEELIAGCHAKRIAVIGDIMLDRYFWGSVSRISPEAPVPVVDVESESFHLGGASNVAVNLHALGVHALMIGVIGDDSSGKTILELIKHNGMDTRGIITDSARPTTVKTRIIGNNQQIARLDREVKTPLDDAIIEYVLSTLHELAILPDDLSPQQVSMDVKSFNKPALAGIVLEDYNKGVITQRLITEVIHFAMSHNIPVFVDPKLTNFFAYKHATLFKPNKKETQDALGYPLTTDEDVCRAGRELLERLQCQNVLITLGARGMMLFEQSGAISSVEAKARHVADVSGAGDTAIATLAAAVAAGASFVEAASLANSAAGAVCEEPGIVAITPERLLEAVERHQ